MSLDRRCNYCPRPAVSCGLCADCLDFERNETPDFDSVAFLVDNEPLSGEDSLSECIRTRQP